jgi:nitrile hydratase accessory protein
MPDLPAPDLSIADHAAIDGAIGAVPGLPRDDGGPVFREPWEAQAFAIVVSLQARGLFTWQEWAATLGEEIRKAQAAGDPVAGNTYYRHWLAALERIVMAKGVASRQALEQHHDAWHHAAARTPHGTPIVLSEADFRD